MTTPPDHTDLSELEAAVRRVLKKTDDVFQFAAIHGYEWHGGDLTPEIMHLFKQYAQPPVVADKELDSLFKLLNDTFESEIDAQEFAIDEGEWMSLIKSLRIAEDKAKAALLQREQRLVAEAREKALKEVWNRTTPSLVPEGWEPDSNLGRWLEKELAQLRHNTNTGKGE